MTKKKLIAALANTSGLTQTQASQFLEALTKTAYREAKSGEFNVPGIGKLVKRKRAAKVTTTPRGGAEAISSAQDSLYFQFDAEAKDAILGQAWRGSSEKRKTKKKGGSTLTGPRRK
jgi:DNA-binding protein HU-beta